MSQNTDRKTYEKKSIRGAVIGLVIFVIIMVVTEAIMICGQYADPIPDGMFVFISALVVIPVIVAIVFLVIRIKEIKGGEEYEAFKY